MAEISAENGLDVKIRTGLGENATIEVRLDKKETVGSAKKRLHQENKISVEPARQRWYYGGARLLDETKCEEIGIVACYVLQCVAKPEGEE